MCNKVIHTWEIDIDEQNFEIAKKYIKILSVLEIDKLKGFKFVQEYSTYLVLHVVGVGLGNLRKRQGKLRTCGN